MSDNNIRILSEPISYQELLPIQGLKITGIYKIENIINHKVYIGQSKNVINRLKRHVRDEGNPHLRKSFEIYGIDKFSFEVLKVTQDLDYWEIFLIQIYHATDNRYGYNIAIGGQNGSQGEKWYQRLLETMNSPEYKEKLKKIMNSPEYRESLSNAQQKRWKSENERKRYSDICSNQWNDPEIRKKRTEKLIGHKTKEETKRKIGQTNSKIILSKHLHWYTNGIESKQLSECPQGWKPGRITNSKGRKLPPRTDEYKKRMSESFTGKVWWNDGKIQIQSKTQPKGFVRGKLPNQKKKHWYNNGKQNIRCEVCPKGYVSGKLLSKESKNHIQNKGYHFYNNGKVQTIAKGCPVGFVLGGLPRKPFTKEHRQKLSESHKKNKT